MGATRVTVLTRSECLALLPTQPIGRVVYTDGALPACAPVNFAVHGSTVVFRTAERSRLALATEDAVVAFEADAIDPRRRTGWSVLVTGPAAPVQDVRTLLRLEQLGLTTWADGERTRWVRIVASLVSGRRIVPAGEVAGDASGDPPVPVGG